jgi:hypothetical protein
MPNAAGPLTGQKLFTPAGIALGTLLGSLVAAVVMVWLNYRTLGYPGLGNRIAAAGILLHLAVITAASVLPNHLAIGLALVLGQAAAVYWITQVLMGKAIAYHQEQGRAVHGFALAAATGLVAGLVSASILLAIGRVFDLPIGLGG